VEDVLKLLELLAMQLMEDMVDQMLELVADLLLWVVDHLVEVVAHAESEKLAQLDLLVAMEAMDTMDNPVMTELPVLMPPLEVQHLLQTFALLVNLHLPDPLVIQDLKVPLVMLVLLDNLPDKLILELPDLLAHPALLEALDNLEDLDLLVNPVLYKMFLAKLDLLDPPDQWEHLDNQANLEQAILDKLDLPALLETLAPLVHQDKLVPPVDLVPMAKLVVAVDAITALLHVPLPVIRNLFFHLCSGYNIDCFCIIVLFFFVICTERENKFY